ncbi:hypothetical protein LXM60_11470 [Pandoraea sputorum]|uniref:hypothetical protein n=1 Tax=Pandoraea sputorum TaxID=93222 RepID=UPI001E2A6A2C|nr:hypothetical protein [Pandoraea sputorum]MCE4060822.1 hypothetical protein [Pandoraea sputorum]
MPSFIGIRSARSRGRFGQKAPFPADGNFGRRTFAARVETTAQTDDVMSRSLDIVDLVVKGEMEKAMMRLHASPGK